VAIKGGFTRGRRFAGLAEGIVAAAVVLLLVAAVVYAATRPALRHRLDLTESREYTLSQQTLSILGDMEQPVEFVTIMRPEIQTLPNGLYEVQQRAIDYVHNLLEEYSIASGGDVTVRRVHPDNDRIEVESLVRELNLTRYNVVIARSGSRSRQIFLEEMVTIDRGLADPQYIQPAELVDLRGEQPLTSVLLDVGREERPRLGVLRGFGGPTADDPADPAGLALFLNGVRGQGIEVLPFDLPDGADVPEDLDVVMLWGPRVGIGPRRAEALATWHDGGGNLLLAVDPIVQDLDMDVLLSRAGVGREQTTICVQDGPWEGVRRSLISISRWQAEHEISAAIERQGIFATFAGAGGLARSRQAPATRRGIVLAITSENVFGDAPSGQGRPGDFVLGPEDNQPGPRNVAMAMEDGGSGRAVVFGCSTFLARDFLTGAEGGRANMDLGLNSVNWLVEREEAIEARPRSVYESRVDLLDSERRQVMLYVLGLMPLGGVLLGVLVWFARRR
jgi:hypothetical protein